ncbi:MATE family efflux transporter [Paenimyroides tangerinum]|uniref:MATE family efflux transporter n=1 Tax=Paenimyroides tangerinum TaxID=2488728 RepID=A0A3P3W5A8_9FLAO|nr:MATE family efflux transporter [Paenimyroides tangerinum]
MEELGVDSFGLYNLIAGVITLLSFFTGALTVSAQRFLSIAIGENNMIKVKKIFNLSLVVHFILALIVVFIFKIVQPFLFNGFLKINEQDMNNAIRVYDIMIVSSAITIFVIPFTSVINAREEMWFSSISDIVSICFKFFAAFILYYVIDEKLLVYTYFMLLSVIIGSIINIIWCRIRYLECRIDLNKRDFDKPLFKEMFGFAGWNSLGSLAVVMRNQGANVVLNVFFGTVVNTAYGIANQLNALVTTFAVTLITVFTPMITKAQGADNQERMLFVSVFSSKLSFFLSSLVSIPILLYTNFILSIWLKEFPEYTLSFCNSIIVTFLIMQLYPGITRAIYASGKIKWYQIIISIMLMANIPIGYLLFKNSYPPISIFYTMIIAQFLTLVITLFFAKMIVQLDIRKFVIESIMKPCLIFVSLYSLGLILNFFLDINEIFKFSIVITLIGVLYSFLFYIFVFNLNEKELFLNLYKSLRNKILKNDKKYN